MQQGLGLARHRNDQDWRWLAPVVLLALGFWFVPLAHTCHMACVPGDLGDARFNGVILEHFYRWLVGKEASLLSPSFFFPMPGAVTFSCTVRLTFCAPVAAPFSAVACSPPSESVRELLYSAPG